VGDPALRAASLRSSALRSGSPTDEESVCSAAQSAVDTQ
jgi:hypothetical protein